MKVSCGVASAFGLLAVLLGGCDRSADPPAPRDAGARATSRGDNQGEPIDPRDVDRDQGVASHASREPAGGSTGVIEGTVRFTGATAPTSTMVPVAADRQFCGHEHSKEDYVIDAGSRGIRYVIVHLAGKGLTRWPRTEPADVVVDNKDCRFEPHAAVLTVGSTIHVKNSDPVLHTTHAYFAASFNFALPRKGSRSRYVVTKPGLIQIRCDQHGWMNTFIRVDRHPFHAVTDARGDFTISDVPSGTYTLSAWHERFAGQEVAVVVRAGETTTHDLTYPIQRDANGAS